MDNNKKKLLVVAVLAVAILAVGAFQFLGGKPEPEAKTKPSKSSKTAGATGTAAGPGSDAAAKINDIVASGQLTEDNPALLAYKDPLAHRDPFAQGTAVLSTPAPGAQQPAPQNTQQPQPKTTWKQPEKPIGPFTDFRLPPGDLSNIPNVGDGGATVRPGTPARSPDEFAMTPIGVIMGNRPAAVFVDDAGNQILVPLGGSIGGDAKVIGIDKNKVRVRHQGKELTFTVGGTPNAQ